MTMGQTLGFNMLYEQKVHAGLLQLSQTCIHTSPMQSGDQARHIQSNHP
jgi:hypothetical protein